MTIAKNRNTYLLKFWANAPKVILAALSLFIYLSYMMIYVVRLIDKSYESSVTYEGAPKVFLPMQKMANYSSQIVGWVEFEYASLDTMQKKGIIYCVVGHFFFLLFIISLIRTVLTSPGQVPQDWHSKTEETFQAVIETEKRVLENLHKTISKQKQEFMKPKTETVIVEATVSQEDDFLLTSKETNYETHVSAVYDKQTGGSVGVPMENNASTDAASTSSYITEGEESAEESSNLKRGSKGKFPKEKINQMAVMSALRRDNKRFCSHCEKFKPERTHHCSQCGVCVLRMDHHCPWLNKCIGFYNYKFFFTMVFWANISLLFITLTYAEAVVDCLFNPEIHWFVAYLTMVSYIVIVILAVIMFFFTFFHLWLISNGRTTLEFCEKKNRGGYNKGTLENFRRILGRCSLTWFIPIAPSHEGGGLTF